MREQSNGRMIGRSRESLIEIRQSSNYYDKVVCPHNLGPEQENPILDVDFVFRVLKKGSD